MAPIRHKNLTGEIGCSAGIKFWIFLAWILSNRYETMLSCWAIQSHRETLCWQHYAVGGFLPLLGQGHWSGLNKYGIWANYSRKTVPKDLDPKDHRETGLWARSKDNRRDNLEKVWMSTSVRVHKRTSHTHTVIAPKLYIMCLKWAVSYWPEDSDCLSWLLSYFNVFLSLWKMECKFMYKHTSSYFYICENSHWHNAFPCS